MQGVAVIKDIPNCSGSQKGIGPQRFSLKKQGSKMENLAPLHSTPGLHLARISTYVRAPSRENHQAPQQT